MNYAVIRRVLEARMHLAESETTDGREERAATEAEALASAEAAIDARYDAAERSQLAGVIVAGIGVAGASAGAVVPYLPFDAPEGLASHIQSGAAGLTVGVQVALGPDGAADEAGTKAQLERQEAELARTEVQASEAARAQSEDRLRTVLLNRPNLA